MKRHSDKLSLCQPTAGATGFSKEQVAICFDLYEKELAAHDQPPSLICIVNEIGLAVVQNKQPKNLTLKGTRQISALPVA